MEVKYAGHCLVCALRLPMGSRAKGRKVQGQWFYICLNCMSRLGESSLRAEVVEVLLIWRNDPNVGGPGDPLNHEDYKVLEALGLWPEAGSEG